MKTKLMTKLISLLLLAVFMLPTMMPVMAVFAADETTYQLDPGTLADVKGTKLNGDTDACGTDNFFTVHYKAETKIEANEKEFLGFNATKRIDFQGALDLNKPVAGGISFTTEASASVKLFWGCAGDTQQIGIYDASRKLVTSTSEKAIKNELYVTTLTIPSAGTYYLGGTTGNCYIYNLEVTTKTIDKGSRASWSSVAAPTFASITTNENGKIAVSVNAFVDHQGADYLSVNMIQDGKVISTVKSTSIKSVHDLLFSPVESGTYTFEAVMTREGEQDKVCVSDPYEYTLPLSVPFITNCANLGGGKVQLVWNPTREAEKYNIYVGPEGNTTLYDTTTERSFVVSGLKGGDTVFFEVEAVRGSSKSEKYTVSLKIGSPATAWDFTVYGPSTNESDNKFKVISENSVNILSTNGRGKIQPTGPDGLAFYYTAIPTDQNFTFRATAVVNFWRFSNGQDGFGLMATDHVPSSDYTTSDFWTNQYMAACTKIEYRYEDIEDGGYNLYTTDSILGDKYSMKLGVGSISKTGINQSVLDRTALGETGLIVVRTVIFLQ